MKLRAIIREETSPAINKVIVQFENDKKQQYFEVKCSFNPHQQGMRKWELWDFSIKWESEVFEDPKTKVKSYFTHLTCDSAKEVSTPYGEKPNHS